MVGHHVTPRSEADEERRVRLRLALIGRLVVMAVTLGGVLLFIPADRLFGFTPRLVLGLVVAGVAVSALGGLGLRTGNSPRSLAILQVVADLLLTSGLVYVTGGAASGFVALFGGVVLEAALVGSTRSTTLVAGLALVLYYLLALALASGILVPPTDQVREALTGAALASELLRGTITLLLVSALAVTLSYRLQRTSGELEEAREREAAHATLTQDIVRSLAAGLVTTDPRGVIRSMNPAARALLGAPEVPSGRLEDYFTLETTQGRSEGVARRGDGTTFPVGYTRAPLHDASGKAVGDIVIFQDLSELVRLRERAARSDRLAFLGSLAAGLAHEIRNPLGSISGSVELVREAPSLGAEDRRLLELVSREAERLNELVTTMLEVGRPAHADARPVALDAWANEVIEFARRGSETPFVLSAVAEVGVFDPAQIRQVLWNLLRNAAQFSPPGAPVRLDVSRAPGATILEVVDQGPGVAPQDRDAIFDVFFTKRRGGVGLGLALARQLVEGHGGTLEVRPNEPTGSIFRAVIPDARPSSLPPMHQGSRSTSRSSTTTGQ